MSRPLLLLPLVLLGAAASAEILHVDGVRGSDARGNGSRGRPLASIEAAIEVAVPGDEVRVAPGVYAEAVVMKAGVDLRGSGPDQTTIDAATLGLAPAVTCASNALLAGFAIVDPRAFIVQGAVDCSNGASPEIAFNRIEAPARIGILLPHGCVSCPTPWIHHNTIRGGLLGVTGGFPGRIVGWGQPIIEDNEIVGGGDTISLAVPEDGSGAVVQRNVLHGRVRVGPPSFGAVGIPVLISDNLFLPSDRGFPFFPDVSGLVVLTNRFLPFDPGELDATIVNNTFFGTGGIDIEGGDATIANNVLVRGSRGVSVTEFARVVLRANDVFANVGGEGRPQDTDYVGLPDPTGIDGNLSVDPAFADPLYRDFRPGPGSPLVDAGSDSDVVSSLDVDGDARVADGDGDGIKRVDIGAQEIQPGEVALPRLVVAVDVLPHRNPNVLPRARLVHGRAPLALAILSADGFDPVDDVDRASLQLGSASARGCHGQHVDRDGVPDLVCQFGTSPPAMTEGSEVVEVCVEGSTQEGRALSGCDSIVVRR